MKALEDYVTTIPDFPKKGIMFRDVTTILSDKDGFKLAIDGLIEALKDVDFDLILGSESRGFIFGAPVAYAMNKGFILVRKKGKLPREVISEDYELEYGSATLEMHADAVKKGQEVMVYEAMKMQNNIESEIEGVVNRILVEPGDVIGANQPLIEFKKK